VRHHVLVLIQTLSHSRGDVLHACGADLPLRGITGPWAGSGSRPKRFPAAPFYFSKPFLFLFL
jgi:hypothetical protein